MKCRYVTKIKFLTSKSIKKKVPIGVMVNKFDSRTGRMGQSDVNAAMFFRSSVAQPLSRGDGRRHSLHDLE